MEIIDEKCTVAGVLGVGKNIHNLLQWVQSNNNAKDTISTPMKQHSQPNIVKNIKNGDYQVRMQNLVNL